MRSLIFEIFKVNLQNRLNTPPVNKVPEPPPKQFECVLKRKEEKQTEQPKSVAEIKGKLEKSEKQPEEPSKYILVLVQIMRLIYSEGTRFRAST